MTQDPAISLSSDTPASALATASGRWRQCRHAGLVAPYAALILALVLAPWMLDGYVLHLVNLAGLTAVSAMALTVLVGTAGLLSLGQAAFLAVGAFSAGVLAQTFDVGFLPAVLLAGMVGLAVGGVVAVATARTAGIYLAVGTFALQYVVELVLTDVEVAFTGASGFLLSPPRLFGLEVATETAWSVLIGVLLVAVLLLLRWIVRSPLAHALQYAAHNPTVAAALGISVFGARASAFMLTAFVASATGAVQGYYAGVVQIGSFPLHLSIIYITIVVLGGPGRLWGALIAAYFITFLPHVLAAVLRAADIDTVRGASLEYIALGGILILALLRIPERVAAWLRNQRRQWRLS